MQRTKAPKLKKPFRWSLRHAGCIALIIFTIFIIVGIYYKLSSVRSFPIKIVKVKGDYIHVDNAILRNTIKPFVNVSIFTLHAAALQASLEQIPWVANANVRRMFPATLIVTINEKQPIAVWNNKALLTADGKLFVVPQGGYPSGIPHLNGPVDQQQDLLKTMQSMNVMLQPLDVSVQQLNLSARNSWSLVLSNGISVTLGQKDLWQRLQRMVIIFPKIIGSRADDVLSMDLRYPNGIAVQWKRGKK